MKKFVSAVIAGAMIASMGATAFAAQPSISSLTEVTGYTTGATGEKIALKIGTADGDDTTVKVDDNKAFFPVVGLKGPYGYSADDKMLFYKEAVTSNSDEYFAPVEYGDTAYYALIQWMPSELKTGITITSTLEKFDGVKINDTTSTNHFADLKGYYTVVTESETVSSIKIKQDWEEGDDLVKSVSIVKKKVCNSDSWSTSSTYEWTGGDSDDDDRYYPGINGLELDKYGLKEGNYAYFLAIKYEDSTSVNDTDVIGTITLSKSKDPAIDKMEFDVEVNVDWENSWRQPTDSDGSSEYKVTGDLELKAEKNYALKFDCDDTVELQFDDDSYFEVDVSGQSKMYFTYNTDYISRIAAKYPYAELNFWNGNCAKFNRVGQMFLSCEDLTGNQFLYQVTSDGKLAEVPGAEWDDSDEGFYFNTRVLGSYVISDMELDVVDNTSSNDNSGSTTVVTPSAPVISNPSTGAMA